MAAAEHLASSLEEATGDVVVLVDEHDSVARWSDRAAELLGTGASEALGKPASEMLQLPARALETVSVLERLRSGERWAAAADPRSAGRAISWSALPFLRDGQFVGAMYRGTLHRPPVAPADADTQRAIQLAFDATMQTQFVLDRQRRVVAQNAPGKEVSIQAFGRVLEPGEDMLRTIAPGLEAAFLDGVSRALSGEEVRRERRVRSANGLEQEYHVQYSPLRDGESIVGLLYGTVSIESTARLSERLELLERALALGPVGVLVCDARADGLPIIYASANVEELTGYSPDEVLGRNPRLFQGRFTEQPALEVVRSALAEGTSCDVVLRNQRKNGTPFWNRLRLSTLRDDLGAVSHFVAVQEDVTEREKRSSSLQATAASEVQSQMLAGVVHDLKNMLTVLSAQVDFAREDATDAAAVRDAMAEAQQAVDRAVSLVRLLLSPLRRGDATPTRVSLSELFRDVSALSKHLMPGDINLQFREPPAGATVLAARRGMEQVLVNLLLNARDAIAAADAADAADAAIAPDAEIAPDAAASAQAAGKRHEVTVWAEAVAMGAPAVHRWCIVVTDTGSGMTEEVQARLFEPYFSTKPRGQGTGLGLSTCAELVQACGGTISATSSPGRGSTFRVQLPAIDATPSTAARRVTLDARRITDREVLVVEPDPSVRAVLCSILRRQGARVVDALDAASARALPPMGDDAALVLALPGCVESGELLSWWLVQSAARTAIVLAEPGTVAPAPRVTQLSKPIDADALVRALARQTGSMKG
jgi:PAS domain S-box-containing protein